MQCPLIQTQTDRKYLAAFNVRVSVSNGRSAELHELGRARCSPPPDGSKAFTSDLNHS